VDSAARRLYSEDIVLQRESSMSRLNGLLTLSGTLLLGLATPAAHAGLGHPVSTLQADQVRLGARAATVTHAAAFDRHAFETQNGVRVRAFAGRDGQVFAVTFEGPAMPDLNVLLGNRFAEYAAAARPSPSTHKVYTYASGTLEMNIVKLPRGFTGSAWVPGAVPSGVNVATLQ
jgi:hypothetical protein